MSTRIISWQQLVDDADPDWMRNKLNPVIYTFSNGRLFTAQNPLYGAFNHAIAGLQNDGGVLILTGDTSAWPMSTNGLGLPPGQIYYDNGMTVCIAPNAPPPPPNSPAIFFPGITSDQLLITNAQLLPLTDPHVNTQLWNNGLTVGVSAG
jgi:hypothetical protein